MCIILTCDKNIRPDAELIESCVRMNPDGAGLAWVADGAVQVCKGLADVDIIMRCIDWAPIDSPLLFHARIATSGGVSVGTCHPFPICTALDALHAPNVECDACIAHNGVIYGIETDERHGISDTVAFVRSTVVREWRANGCKPTKAFKRRVLDEAPFHNRFATLDATGRVSRFGYGWETVTRGIQASNDSWRWGYRFDTPDDSDFVYDNEWYQLPTWCMSCESYNDCSANGWPGCDMGWAE